jgi:hypothetical protein
MNPNLIEAGRPHALCIFVDVDGTLIRFQGGTSRPDGDLVLRARQWKSEGALLYCWSSRGADYAQKIARQLQIEDCFSAFLCKPHVLVDDQSLNDWPCLVHLYPAQVGNHSLDSLRNMVDGATPA